MVDYTDVSRDTGAKPVKVLSSHLEAFLRVFPIPPAVLWRGQEWRAKASQGTNIAV